MSQSVEVQIHGRSSCRLHLLAIAGAWWFDVSTRRDSAQPAPAHEAAPVLAEVRTELDLRKYAASRSEQKREQQPPISLPRGRVSATILLPSVL